MDGMAAQDKVLSTLPETILLRCDNRARRRRSGSITCRGIRESRGSIGSGCELAFELGNCGLFLRRHLAGWCYVGLGLGRDKS